MAKKVAAVVNKNVEAAVQATSKAGSGKYWETEKPVLVDTGNNVLRYFAGAGKLQVSMPAWLNKTTGEMCPGKTVTLDVAALKASKDGVKLIVSLLK